MSSEDLEEYKRELVENKLNRYDSSNKEHKHEEGRQSIQSPQTPVHRQDQASGHQTNQEPRLPKRVIEKT